VQASKRDAMLVESTRSQNLTVTCRRSPMASVGGGAIGAGWGGSVVWRSPAATLEGLDADGDFSDGRQYFPAMPEQDASGCSGLTNPFRATMLATEGDNHADVG
jgi:hypothetical protein